MTIESWAGDVTELAQEAAALALQRFHEGAGWIEKGQGDWASDADLEVEQLIRKGLAAIAPGTRVHGEEAGMGDPSALGSSSAQSALTWHVDPIDGSANFVRGIPHFATVISLSEQTPSGDVCIHFGVTVDPCRSESFVAVRGNRTQLNGRDIHVAAERSAMKSLLAVVTPKPDVRYMESFLKWFSQQIVSVGGVRRSGAMAIDLAWLACGRIDAFAGFELAPWDIYAGVIQVVGAGGCAEPHHRIRSFPNEEPLQLCLVANSDSLLSKLSGDEDGS